MKPFPQEWELLSLFECEPVVEDPDMPWAYNRLRFETIRGADRILCVIEPGYYNFSFEWHHRDHCRLALDLHWVKGLQIETGGGNDRLLATFSDDHLLPLTIQFRPIISCRWETSKEFPT